MVMMDIQLTDPDDLSGDEKDRMKYLLRLPGEEFDKEIRRYVADPDESSQMVFRHPEIVELTKDSLDRLIAQAQQRRQHAQTALKRRMADDQLGKLGRERKAIRPYFNLALAEAARNTPRARAERILGRLLYPVLKPIIRDLEAGCSEKEAETRARARMKASS